jgi:hypothetical protein
MVGKICILLSIPLYFKYIYPTIVIDIKSTEVISEPQFGRYINTYVLIYHRDTGITLVHTGIAKYTENVWFNRMLKEYHILVNKINLYYLDRKESNNMCRRYRLINMYI